MLSGINEDDADTLLLDLHYVNNEESKQHDICANIYFEAVVLVKRGRFFFW